MLMAPRKQIITHNDVPSKGKTNSIVGGTVPPPAVNQQHATEDTGSSPQEAAASVRPTPLFEGQILQILVDVKEQIKEHQAQSDRDWEQATLDHKRAVHKQEVLKYNNQLQAQIATLQKAKNKCGWKASLKSEIRLMGPSQIRGGPD